MKKTILYISVAATTLFTACSLERLPHGSMSNDHIVNNPQELLEYTLNGAYGQMKGWADVMHRCGEYAGDNMMIRGTSTDAFYEFISYSRTPNNYRLNSFWNNSYKAIAQTSNILKMIPEGQSAEVDSKLGECYFLRGMNYFYLVRAYGRPYYQSPETNLGVPIVNGTPDDIFNINFPDRATVKETYEQAISDLRKAEELMSTNNGPAFGSKEAAQALLSRVYLYMSGTYQSPNSEYADLAIQYATKVIESGRYELLSREDFMIYNTMRPENNKESIFVIKRLASEYSGYDHYYGVGGMYGVIGGMGWGEMYASAKYIDLLNETGRNDWANGVIVDARAKFIEPQYSAVVSGKDYRKSVFRFIYDVYNNAGEHSNYNYAQLSVNINETTGEVIHEANGTVICYEGENNTPYTLSPLGDGYYSITYSDGKTYEGVIDWEMRLNRVYPMFYISKCSREGEESHLHSPIITRLSEIYLNRAEAYAKKGDYARALTDLNMVRERSIIGGSYTSLDASNAAERIDKERQLELAYQAERSYDVYRNGDYLERAYPGPHNAMERVSPTDYRVVYFIPQDAINSYPGTLTQNPTSN
ncbi:MAG: RagB/SusD family nutrient uptake outer membrane protein [Phocaeicola sp.]